MVMYLWHAIVANFQYYISGAQKITPLVLNLLSLFQEVSVYIYSLYIDN